jgi:hypothetical protein
MTRITKRGFPLLFAVLVLCSGGRAAAADFGLVLLSTGEYAPEEDEGNAGFTGSAAPWVSAAIGKTGNLYASGKLSFEYAGEAWKKPVLFELERTELTFRPAPAAFVSAGRQRYRDAGGMIASGLFDGLSAGIGFTRARLSLGAFYTGLLYKGTAEIFMTGPDRERNAAAVDYGDIESYFASRRILVPLTFEFPDLSPRTALTLTLLAQFDVNGGADTTHSQYLEAVAGIAALDTLRFSVTGIGALAESGGAGPKLHAAGAFGADWDLPGALTDMLRGELRWGSGAAHDRIGPFVPVTGIAQGTIFTPALSGLLNARISYTARPGETVSASGEAAAFWRTDTETFADGDLDDGSAERFLGVELYGSVVWAPQSALRFTAGGGAFLPGGAFRDGTKVRWKLSGGIILSL